ncbi:hypothetical protein BTO32_01710 [Marinobacter lutaoensis]|uniref:Uncharacterized protein n=1 Tax=Marinobacter lutaoensis TaxID=135739 RepID=A0A1V2DWQ5_9GAMM|nr:hypothetical protein [Marinobacter lutaoensis]ONF45214.1 hypothetical protein BTO32_01710 [Marinobacter lutaoensis]
MEDYFLRLDALHPSCLAKILLGEKLPKGGEVWEFTNEIKPIDLYCYLYAKYGQPNGMQNFFRSDDSDNLIHWEWALAGEYGLTLVQGHNFRTEVHLIGDFKGKALTLENFITQIKSDIGNYGRQISELRKDLEKWTQFVNPYHRIFSAVDQHFKRLNELNINPEEDKVPQPKSADDMVLYQERWGAVAEKYSFAVGLVFGLRSMLPVLGESFVNLILFMLCKKDIKNNDRLFQNVLRQPIDVRVQSLHINCVGFEEHIDYSSKECGDFHSLMNERNDLLHGNVEVNKLAIGDVYFRGKVPIFLEYQDFWDRSIGVSLDSVGFKGIYKDHDAVTNFIKYIMSKLNPEVRSEVALTVGRRQLGFNKKNGRLGVLLPEHMVDFRPVYK